MFSVYFKVVFTTHTRTCRVSKNITVSEFIQFAKQQNQNQNQNQEIEVVEAGQPGGEYAPALSPHDNTSLQQKYINHSNYEGESDNVLAFYIRPINQNQNQNQQNQSVHCVICQETIDSNSNSRLLYNCSHRLCENCLTESLRHNFQRCSICRVGPTNNND